MLLSPYAVRFRVSIDSASRTPKAFLSQKHPIMTNSRVLNTSRGFSLKHKQALRAVDECAAAWVEFGISIRDLTLAESIARRNEQAKLREPLAFAEIPGLFFQPSPSGQYSSRQGYSLIHEANRFCANA